MQGYANLYFNLGVFCVISDMDNIFSPSDITVFPIFLAVYNIRLSSVSRDNMDNWIHFPFVSSGISILVSGAALARPN